MTGTGQCAAPGIAQGDIDDSGYLPRPAVRLGYRLAQLSNGQRAVAVQIVIVDGSWHLILPGGHAENLGKNDETGGSER